MSTIIVIVLWPFRDLRPFTPAFFNRLLQLKLKDAEVSGLSNACEKSGMP